MKLSSSYKDISAMFKEAAVTGIISFKTVPYEDFLEFLKVHSPKFKLSIGKKDPEFIRELNRLSSVATSLQK